MSNIVNQRLPNVSPDQIQYQPAKGEIYNPYVRQAYVPSPERNQNPKPVRYLKNQDSNNIIQALFPTKPEKQPKALYPQKFESHISFDYNAKPEIPQKNQNKSNQGSTDFTWDPIKPVPNNKEVESVFNKPEENFKGGRKHFLNYKNGESLFRGENPPINKIRRDQQDQVAGLVKQLYQ